MSRSGNACGQILGRVAVIVMPAVSLLTPAEIGAQEFLSERVVENLHSSTQDMMRLPVEGDLSALELRVVGTEIVDSLSNFQTELKASEGAKLVAVTLGGTQGAAEKTRFDVSATDFSALCTKTFSNGVIQGLVVTSSAIWHEQWIVQGASTVFALDPGPITLKVAFVVPDEVETFTLRYPHEVEGRVEVPPQ